MYRLWWLRVLLVGFSYPKPFLRFFLTFSITSPEWDSSMLLIVVVAIHVAFPFLVSSPERAWRLWWKREARFFFYGLCLLFLLLMPHLSLDAFAVGFAGAIGARIELNWIGLNLIWVVRFRVVWIGIEHCTLASYNNDIMINYEAKLNPGTVRVHRTPATSGTFVFV